MFSLYDLNAPKKPTNLTVNSDLLKQSKALGINLSATLEQALTQQLKVKRAELWLEQNNAAIAAYNQSVEENGVFGDDLRLF